MSLDLARVNPEERRTPWKATSILAEVAHDRGSLATDSAGLPCLL
jgi:hypothetical protein